MLILLKACTLTLKNTNTETLLVVTVWNALGQASGRDVAAFMDSWLEQPGYPVLTATVEMMF